MGLDADRIEKAAIAIFATQTNWATSNPDNRQIREWWDAQPDMVKDATRRLARAALESQTGEPDPLEWADVDMETLDGRTVEAVTKDGTIVQGRTVAVHGSLDQLAVEGILQPLLMRLPGEHWRLASGWKSLVFLQQNKGAIIMKHILLGFIAVLSLMLVPLILMHKGKGGGFSNFAESLTGSAGSSGVAEKNLNRWTVVAAVVWFVLIIAYGILVKLS